MIVEIDDKSGFCYGVIRTIERIESELKNTKKIYSLGDVVHNDVEVKRLKQLGLQSITHDDLPKIKGEKLFIRAHGEPPSTYENAHKNGIEIIDCTCPVVLKLQERIKKSYDELQKINGQLVIFGRKNHAEVNGLIGQVNGDAIVVEKIEDIENIDFSRPVFLFSQTTKGIEKFNKLSDEIRARMQKASNGGNFIFEAHNTICGQVSSRKPHLEEFSRRHDVIIFVSGKQSSNGQVLYNACKNVNPHSFFVEEETGLQKSWFANAKSVGICGATSTPKWLMERIKNVIEKF